MSNIIQIKTGNTAPAEGVLKDAELGFSRDEEALYIGKWDGLKNKVIKLTHKLDKTLKLSGAAAEAKTTGEAIEAIDQNITSHINNKSNPHNVTSAQIGAATSIELNGHINNKSNPHGVTPQQIGAPVGFSTSPSTPGSNGKWGYVFSRAGNTYNNFSQDNYYIKVDADNTASLGIQINNSPSIVWTKLLSESDKHIIASGTSGIWTYRKWSDGTAECWGSLRNSGEISEQWGSDYCGLYNKYLDYPFTFTTIPTEFATLHTSGFGGYLYTEGTNTATHSAKYGILRSAPQYGTVNITIDIYAIGKWR